MYEIDGNPISEDVLRKKAEELNITFERLLEINSDLIKRVGETNNPLGSPAGLEATVVEQSEVEADVDSTEGNRLLTEEEQLDFAFGPVDTKPFVPINTITGQPINTPEAINNVGLLAPENNQDQALTEKEKTSIEKSNSGKLYEEQIQGYNDKINNIANRTDIDGNERLKLINEIPVPVFTKPNLNYSDVQKDENQKPENIENEYLYNNEILEALKEKLRQNTFGEDKEIYNEFFDNSINNDPLVSSRRDFYIKNLAPKVDAYRDELVEADLWDLNTRGGVDALQQKVNEYYATIVDKSMMNDPVILSQSKKISEAMGKVDGERRTEIGRSKSTLYSWSDKWQERFGNGKGNWLGNALTNAVAGVESMGVSMQSLGPNTFNTIGAQVDGKRIRDSEEVLNKLSELTQQGKNDNDEVSIRIGERKEGIADDRVLIQGTIQELREGAEKNLSEGGKSLEENIEQLNEFEDYRNMAAQANFSDGISWRDAMIGLGGSIPQMAAVSAGTALSVVAPQVGIPIMTALNTIGGSLVTAQFYGENYMEGVKEGMLADGNKYPNGITPEDLNKAIASGEYDNVGQDLATAALMSRLEKLGATKTLKAFFKSMNVGYKQGVKSLFRGDVKAILKNMKDGVIKQTPNSFIEGLTEAGQSTLQQINTGAKQGDVFKYLNGEETWENFLAGVTVGTVLPGFGAVGYQGRVEMRTAALKFAKEFSPNSNLAKTEQFYKTALQKVKEKYSDGNGNIINKKAYQEEIEDISSIRNAGLRVPGKFSQKARNESLDLLVERAKIERDIDGLEPEQVGPEKLRIAQINKRLSNIAKAEDIINKSKKVADQLSDDVIDDFLTFEDEESLKQYLRDNTNDTEEEIEAAASGRAVETNIDGKEVALINLDKISNGVGYFAGAHEILHKFLKNTLRTNPDKVFGMADVIKKRLKAIQDQSDKTGIPNENLEMLKNTLNKYKIDATVNTQAEAEEMITLFSEFVDLGLIAKDKKLGGALKDSWRRINQNLPGAKDIAFNNADDILDFIGDYNKSINKGRLTRAQVKAANQGINISDDLDVAGLEFDKERNTSKAKANESKKQAKDIEIKGLIDNMGIDNESLPSALAFQFEEDVRRYVNGREFVIGNTPVKDNPKVAGVIDSETGFQSEGAVTVDDMVFQILSDKRGVIDYVNKYLAKPESYRNTITLGQFIGKAIKEFDPYRAIEIVAPMLGVQSDEVTQSKPKQDFSKEEKKSLRQSFLELGNDLDIKEGGDFYNKVIESTKRTLGTTLGDVSSGKFLKALRNAAIADLETDVKKLMGTPTSAKYRNFIEKYAAAILSKAQQTTLNKRLGKLTEPIIDEKTGKQARTLAEESRSEGSRVKDPYAGNPKRRLKPGLSPKDLTDFFVDIERPDAKRNSLAKIAAIEFTEDALRQVLDSKVEDNLGKKPGEEGYELTTLTDERAEKFGRDKVEAEIMFISRELGRGNDYKLAKDIDIPTDLLSEFVDKANELTDLAYSLDGGYKDEEGNYKPEFQEAIEGVDDNVIKAIDMLLEEDPMLEQGAEFVKVIKKDLKEGNDQEQKLGKQIDNKNHIITSKNKGVRTINKPAAESMNNFAQTLVKIIDSDLIKAFNSTLEFVGFSNRLLDPAKLKKSIGKAGEYYNQYIKARASKFKKANNINTADVMPMNKTLPLLSKVLKPLIGDGTVANKLSLLQNSEQTIQDANVANMELFKNLMLEIQEEYKNGKKITPLQLFQFFQLQTGVVKGLRALSKLEYVYLIDGNQDIESFKKKRLSKEKFLELDTEQQDASIQEFIDEFPEFKGRYDLRLKNNINALDKNGKKKYTLEEAKVQAAFGAGTSAYVDLIIKGEHLVPNTITMTKLFQGMLKGTLTNASLNEILSGHTQFFGPNYIMDLIDSKGIEGGKKIAKTSPEGILRLTKFLNKQTGISNNIYYLNGEKAYKQIFKQEILDKKIKVLSRSINQAKDIDIDLLQNTGVLDINEDMSMQDVLNKAATIDEALRIARDPKAPIRKIRVFDFDDTLATSNNIVIATSPDGTVTELNAEQFATEGFDLQSKGYNFNFDDFNNVTDGGRGPLFNLAKQIRDARGNEDLFVLTARASEAAPAIYEFLKSQGLEIPLKNITGLGKSTGAAKANWIIDKAAEGYNDFYFADDAIQNVSAVRSALDIVDVKSTVQQAKYKQAKDIDSDFNKIIEQKTGIASEKQYSKAKAQVRGKDKFQFFIPYSAEDFTGLIYPLLSKGDLGDKQMAWFKHNLIDPFARANINLQQARVNLMGDFKKLKEDLNVPKDLGKEAVDGFTNEQAVRVYLWNKQGLEVPGLSKSDTKEMISIIENNSTLKEFADQLLTINKDPYPAPLKEWLVGNITTDLMRGLKEVKRPEYLKEWQDNVDIIFSEKNLNKLEAAYGAKYVEALKNILSRMKNGSNRLQEGNRLSNKILNYINGSNAAIMFFNTRSAILQTISSINFMNWSFNNPLKAGAAFANQPQYWKDFMYLMNSDFLKDRRNGLRINIAESEIADAAATSKNKAKGVLNYILSKGYAPTQYADSFAIASGGATYYRNRIVDLVKNGMTEAKAKEQAMIEFMELTEENQQSSRPDKISQQQSSDYGRLILMFANTPMQYARLQKRAFQDLAAGRGDSKTNVSKIIYYGVVQNIIFNSLQQAIFGLGFGDEDDEELEAANTKAKNKKAMDIANGMLDSMLRGVGIGGAAVSVIKNFLFDIYKRSGRDKPDYVDSIFKLLQFSPPIGSKISRIRQAAWQFDSKKRRQEMLDKGFSLDNPAFLASAKVVSATTNVPLDRVLLKIDNLSAVMDEDTETWQKIALGAGWSKWSIETPKQKRNKGREELYKDPNGYTAWEQKSILKQYGLKSWEIKRLKNEEGRVKRILQLQKSKNKNYNPKIEDKPLSKEDKKAEKIRKKAENLRKYNEKFNK